MNSMIEREPNKAERPKSNEQRRANYQCVANESYEQCEFMVQHEPSMRYGLSPIL